MMQINEEQKWILKAQELFHDFVDVIQKHQEQGEVKIGSACMATALLKESLKHQFPEDTKIVDQILIKLPITDLPEVKLH